MQASIDGGSIETFMVTCWRKTFNTVDYVSWRYNYSIQKVNNKSIKGRYECRESIY